MQNRIVPNNEFFSFTLALLKDGKSVKFFGKGKSMTPIIINMRDEILIASVKDQTIHINDIVLFINPQNRHFTLHRVIKIKNGIYTIQGDGNAYIKEQCTIENIYGIVKEIHRHNRPGKTHIVKRDSFEWRLWVYAGVIWRMILRIYSKTVMPIKRKYMAKKVK